MKIATYKNQYFFMLIRFSWLSFRNKEKALRIPGGLYYSNSKGEL